MAATTFELIGLCPAEPGWRAVFSGGGAPGPVVAWGVFRERQGSQDVGTSMEGLLADQQATGPVRGFVRASAASNFEGYLAPNVP